MTNKQKEIKNNEAQTHMKQYEEENVLLEYTVFMRNMYIDLYKQAVKEYEKNPEQDENKCHIYHEACNKMYQGVFEYLEKFIKKRNKFLNRKENYSSGVWRARVKRHFSTYKLTKESPPEEIHFI